MSSGTARTSIAWLSDMHLDFTDPAARVRPILDVLLTNAELVVLSGDIAQANTVCAELSEMATLLDLPIYFVLGNHDYYLGSIAEVRESVRGLCLQDQRLIYLTTAGVQALTERTGLVGHDGWGDGGYGDAAGSEVLLNDFFLIRELSGLEAEARLVAIRELGVEAATQLKHDLIEALDRFEEVIVVTHVPPFREACLYKGEVASDEYLPFFACRATGEVLREGALAYPHRRIKVLCGHTHCAGEVKIEPNLEVVTAGAQYGHPVVERLLELT